MINRRLQAAASLFICPILSACAAPTKPPGWLKAGAEDASIKRELRDCNRQASGALASEQEIINAMLGRNWILQGLPVVPLEPQSMRQHADEYAEQVLNNCMHAKGFTKEG
jgi:hypothetical protein